MRTCDRIADEVEAEARAWIERMIRRAGPDQTERANFGPGRRVSVIVEWSKAEGWDPAMGRWAILASGPLDSHQGSVPRSLDSALRVVREGTKEVLEKMEESMRWMRSRGVDLRELADEMTVVDVLET